jgi:HK97 family phage prohead protease
MSNFSLNIPITKVDEEQRIVYGYATVEELDRQGDIVDYDASKEAFGAWAGNIREQHDNKRTIGKNVHLEFDDDNKRVLIGAYVSKSADGENAWTKVKEGILTGFSIGARVVKSIRETVKSGDTDVTANRIMGYTLHEVSLVDVPACPSAQFVMVKSFNGEIKQVNEMHESITEPWYFKSFAIAPEQLNQKAISSDTTNMSKETTMSNDEVNKATAPYGGVARDETAQPVNADVNGGQPDESLPPKHKIEEPVIGIPVEGDVKDNKVTVQAKPAKLDADVQAQKQPKKADTGTINKGLYGVANLAECLENLTWIAESAEFEAMYEGDNSTVPAQLRDAVKQVGAILSNMVTEEVAEASAAEGDELDLADKPTTTKADTGIDANKDDLIKSLTSVFTDKVAELITPLVGRIDAMESQRASNAPVRSYSVVDKVADQPQQQSVNDQLMQKSDDMLAHPEKYSVSDRSNLMIELMKQRKA